MYKYEINQKINDLTVVRRKLEVGHEAYILRCKCGSHCHFYGTELPQLNCGMCYRATERKPKGRPEMFTQEYKSWRQRVYARDKHKCVCCGSKYKLNAHHMNGWHWSIAERYSLGNGVTLCGWSITNEHHQGCHDRFHNIYGNKNNTRHQFDSYLRTYYNRSLSTLGLE